MSVQPNRTAVRPLTDRILVRVPVLAHAGATLLARVPAGSTPRKRMITWAFANAFAAMNRGDVEAVLVNYEADVEILVKGLEATGMSQRYDGHSGLYEMSADTSEGFGDWGWRTLSLTDGGERIAVRGEMNSRGRVSGVPTTIRNAGMAFFLSARGRVARQHFYMEDGGWARALEAAGLSE